MNIKTLVYKFAMVWRAKKVWKKPKTAKTLIFDRSGSKVFLEYLKKDNVEILDVRGESINLHVMLRCFFFLEMSSVDYINKYISIVNPSVILTFIDNNHRFYELKRTHPRSITISIQNGFRDDYLFAILKKNARNKNYHADYMLTHNTSIGAEYNKHINGQIISIGSMKSNLCQVEKDVIENSLVFISQFRPPPGNSKQSPYNNPGMPHFTWYDFYSAERKVINFIANYCERKNLSFQVCAAGGDTLHEEYEFFRELIGGNKWKFIPKDDIYSSYKTIDHAEFVIGIDSTLTYESLARGKKVGFFSIRSNLIDNPTSKFGWPEKLPDNGPFWTYYADESEFERVLDYLTSVSNIDWEKTRQQYVTNLIEYDPGNTRFIALLQKLNVQLNDRYISHAQ